ncbi:MAG: cysteine desulfurase [Phycisphaeraceae bacterium]|nr:cysteine desulfurase [Phycisphaeraceae bacterium]
MVYLDHNATTPPLAEVIDAERRAETQAWANASSVHRAGQDARRLLELARQHLADLLHAPAKQLVLTGSGTEAIDLAIRGGLEARAASGRRAVASTAVEHAAVRDLLEHLAGRGEIDLRQLPLLADGRVDADGAERVIDASVALVSVQWANNETGAVQPVERLGALCRSRGAGFHCDGTQWVGKMPVADGPGAPAAWADYLSFSPHKFHGPKGVGALWVRPGAGLVPRLHGAQELGRRAGTENVPAIVGAGVAAAVAAAWLADPAGRARQGALRDTLERAVLEACPGAVVNGPRDAALRLWNTTNIGFPRLEAEALILTMSELGLAASAGAACSSGSLEPSPVLLAMGVPPEIAHGSVRFSLSRFTTADEIDQGVRIIVESVRRVGAGKC